MRRLSHGSKPDKGYIKSIALHSRLLSLIFISEIMSSESSTYDYIIVGGGLCGCVLASRLHQQNPSLRILLIEAGPDSEGHPVPSAPSNLFVSSTAEIDWGFATVPQKHLNNRSYPIRAGKILSGGTALNAAAWIRGSKVDYDHWAKVVGDERWSYEGMLPYFRRSERHWDPRVDAKQHGFEGPVYTSSVTASDPERRYPLKEPLRAALESAGLKFNEDMNNGEPLGFNEAVENWKDGRRQCVREAYNLEGVELLLNSTVHRVIVENGSGKRRAVGVELVGGKRIMASKEVILSSGTIGSPKILMLSGIGPAEELKSHRIPLILEAPGVGQNYHDHLSIRQWWKLRNPEAGLAVGSPKWINPAYAKGSPVDWVLYQQTPLNKLHSALELDGAAEDNQHLLLPKICHTETLIVYMPIGAAQAGVQIPIDGTHITTVLVGSLPTSRGTVKLASADPSSRPVVDPNDYATEADRCSMQEGVRQIFRMILGTSDGREIVEDSVPPPGCPKLALASTDEEIDAHIRQLASTTFHPAGTAAMGDVVDSELRVNGFEGLRVVDASVLPVPIAGHYQVPLYALAEQAADLILVV